MRHRRDRRARARSPRRRCCGCATPSVHRGPDDWGTFVEGGVGLGMRRLSIIDLAGGHQPIAQRGRQRAGRPQRRDLQPRGAARRSWWRAGTSSAPGATPRSSSTCTRTRASGCSSGSAACSRSRSGTAAAQRLLRGARPLRAEAAVLHRARRPAHVRLRDQGAAGARSRAWRRCRPFALDQYLTLRFVQAPDTFFERIRALPPAHFLVWESGATRDRALLGPGLRPEVDVLRGGDARADRRAAGGDGGRSISRATCRWARS